jgi:two-component system, NarL family, invasion response regulator UvrY
MHVEAETEARRIRTLVVDDHPLYRLGLRVALQLEHDIEVVGEADKEVEALALAAHLVPDVAIVDLSLAEGDGVSLTCALRTRNPECSILVVSGESEPLVVAQVLRAGANGYVSKTEAADEIVTAIRTVQQGSRYVSPSIRLDDEPVASDLLAQLSARELEVLALLVVGQSNDEIATALFISRRTVETHRQRVMNKLGAHTIADLVHIAARLGVGKP